MFENLCPDSRRLIELQQQPRPGYTPREGQRHGLQIGHHKGPIDRSGQHLATQDILAKEE